MPCDDDVLYFQYVNGIVEYAKHVHVGVHADIGDIAVYEHLSGLGIGNLVGGYAAVSTANPEDLRMLAVRKLLVTT